MQRSSRAFGVLVAIAGIAYLVLPFLSSGRATITGLESLSHAGSRTLARVLTYGLPIAYLVSIASAFAPRAPTVVRVGSVLACVSAYIAWFVEFRDTVVTLAWGAWISCFLLFIAVLVELGARGWEDDPSPRSPS